MHRVALLCLVVAVLSGCGDGREANSAERHAFRLEAGVLVEDSLQTNSSAGRGKAGSPPPMGATTSTHSIAATGAISATVAAKEILPAALLRAASVTSTAAKTGADSNHAVLPPL